jgi:hypothetical protein
MVPKTNQTFPSVLRPTLHKSLPLPSRTERRKQKAAAKSWQFRFKAWYEQPATVTRSSASTATENLLKGNSGLGCSIVIPVPGRASGAGFGPDRAGPLAQTDPMRYQTARVYGPGNLGLDFGPVAQAFRPKLAQKPAPKDHPGDRKHY